MAQGITPPPSVLPIQIQGVSAYGTTGNATSIPPAIAVLPTGTLLRGMITGRNAQGQLVLHTEKGDIALKTDIFFRRGVELMIRMERMHDETTARIITVDGRSLAKYIESGGGATPPEEDAIVHTPLMRQSANPTPQEAKEAKAPLMPSQPMATPPSGNTPVAARMTAILLTSLPAQNPDSPLPPQIVQLLQHAQAGTQLAVKITQLVLPQATPAPLTSPPSGTGAPALPASLKAYSPTLPPLPPTLHASAAPTAALAPAAPLPTHTTPALPPVASQNSSIPVLPAAPAAANATSASVYTHLAPLPAASPAQAAPLLGTAYTASEFGATPPPAPPPSVVAAPISGAPTTALPATAPLPTTTSPLPAPSLPPASAGVGPAPAQPAAATVPSTSTAPATPPAPLPSVVAVSGSAPPAAPPATSGSSTATLVPLPAAPLPTTITAPSTTAPLPPQIPAASTNVATAAPTTTALSAVSHTAPSVQTAAPIPTSPAPITLTATVLEGSADNGLTLHSPLGTLRLLSPTPLPTGTQVQFEVEYALPASPSSPTTATAGTSKTVPSLETLAALPLPLAAALPEALALHPRIIPKPGRELTTEIMFLMSAIKGGDLRKWLGEDTHRRLESTQAETLKRIAAEFGMMRQSIGEEGEPVRWTLYQLPFATAVGIEPLRIYHRDTRDKEKKEEGKKGEAGEHFIVDVMFTRIGTLQLDGFVKKSPARSSFDLVVRSEKPLEEEMKQGIREIFIEAAEITGYEGAVSFREGREALFILPQPQPDSPADSTAQSIVV